MSRVRVYVLVCKAAHDWTGDTKCYPSAWCENMRSQRLAVRFASVAGAIEWRDEMAAASPQSRAWMRGCVPVRLVRREQKAKPDGWTTEGVLNRAIRLLQIQNDGLAVQLAKARGGAE